MENKIAHVLRTARDMKDAVEKLAAIPELPHYMEDEVEKLVEIADMVKYELDDIDNDFDEFKKKLDETVDELDDANSQIEMLENGESQSLYDGYKDEILARMKAEMSLPELQDLENRLRNKYHKRKFEQHYV